jgi:lysophospholipase L1-like esterase
MKRIKRFFKYLLIVLVSLELAFWILGYRPYTYVPFKVESTPENALSGDSILGFRLNPGSYQITLQDTLTFQAQHTAAGRRNIPGNPVESNKNEQIHFYGCSFTYGYGVNDGETFAALTQEAFPDHKIVNHAVMGYGTIQSYLQVLENKEIRANDLVVLCFSSEHFKRNVLSNAYRLHLKIGFENASVNLNQQMKGARFPYWNHCDSTPQFEQWENIYAHWPLREYSPGVNLLQSQVERFQDAQINEVGLTACLIERMAAKVSDLNGRFLVVCLDTNETTKKLQEQTNVPFWLNVGFDFNDQHLTNHPFDTHPNASGHRVIADKIIPFLASFVYE